MKKATLILALIGITFMSFGNPTKIEKPENESVLVKQLVGKLNLPEALKKKSNSGIIKIEFIVNDNNEVEVKNISGKNLEISNYIKSKFETSEIKLSSLEKNISYFIDINLQII